ncbi:cyclin-dependent kinase G-2 isoform X2 [Selaginella moellendorffii]|uniref:cyclin-dependent kinase G-2 isoform X2 n=1 Tax=Selaginella moellendorffii TaxID=88036 RepID=UPI000D1C23C4|nr:cyclin-dependent kinase G-2 isoform X2 [Selaginella moellendorffii]|eukprot:XP_024521557.1 cyclin-dependent kinase G-2 isoform X2 [Selaginella moellendorffii]
MHLVRGMDLDRDRPDNERNGVRAYIATDSRDVEGDDGISRKRKYSPIVWDLDDGRKSDAAPPLSRFSEAAAAGEDETQPIDTDVLSSGGGCAQDNSGSRDEEQRYEQELNEKELVELSDDDGSAPDERSGSDSDYDDRSPPPQLRSIDMLRGCRSVDEFERLNKIDEGTYGVVYRARDKKSGEIVALKRVKMDHEREGFPMTSLREINVLLSFHHPSIVDVKEVVVGSNLDSIFMVMEYMEHDLKGLMDAMKQPFTQSEAKCLMLQLFEGVKYLHDNWVLHRDLKTSNLLLNNRGDLKICDFGLARQYGSPLKTYTRMVVTLWYRAPELLLGSKKYNAAIDMWSLGCIMAEFLAKEPLFTGKSEIDQLDKIFKTLGTPNEKIWPNFVNLPGVKCNFVRQPYNRLREKFPPVAFGGRPALSEKGYDLLNKLLTYDPSKRITAEEALNHEWFDEVPLPKMKELMPTFPVRSDQDRRLRRAMKSPDPLEEQRRRELRGEFGAGVFG